MKIKIHALVSGDVQGVFFRTTTELRARELGLTGWVRNLDNGMVEVVAEGGESEVFKLVEFLRTGPRHAQVSNVVVKKQKYKGEFSSFKII